MVLVAVAATPSSARAAAPYDPRGTWNAVFDCQTGWCTGRQFKRVVDITQWDPTTGAFSGTLSHGTFSGTVSGSSITATSTDLDPAISSKPINEQFTLVVSPDGLTWSGRGTGSSGSTGAETMTLRTPFPTSPSTIPATTPATPETSPPTVPDTIGVAIGGNGGGQPTGSTTTTTAVARPSAVSTDGRRSTFIGLPSPSQALTLKNVALAGLLSVVLMLIVMFPSTLFNNTLEANIEVVRNWFPRWMRGMIDTTPTIAVTADAGTHPGAEPEGAPAAARTLTKHPFWRSWPGFVSYMAIAALLYSFTQPGWGLNDATASTLLGFVIGLSVSTFTGIATARTYLRRYGKVDGHMEVEIATLAFAILCVVASRLANFTPGYFYGVLAGYIPTTHKPSNDDSRRMKVRALQLTFVLAIAGWVLFTPLQHVAGHPGFFNGLPLSLAGGLVTGAVETIVIGLIPITFLPGYALKQWNAKVWAVSYIAGAFLFSLVLLRPGLVGAHEASVVWTLGVATFFAVCSVAFWWYFRQRAERLKVVQPTTPA